MSMRGVKFNVEPVNEVGMRIWTLGLTSEDLKDQGTFWGIFQLFIKIPLLKKAAGQ